jgi:hypothetical protein
MDDEQKQAWDELTRWINDATDLAVAGNLKALWQSIGQLSDEHARGVLMVAILARVDDYDRIKDHYRDWMSERMAEWPLQSDN